ncbi:hypothetical protein [Phyllobacterium sp. YR531]|uniref:hypothetical protein n=1 Tax=Phyllobacterium sp. YR531 TaxID=1144343 RepID=UPI00026FB2E6|nr:hypothetical protein [Phyllobacterium sp. YR531]EJM98126.1 hypothetical protein PMI41_04885 [Phyllobacterium sp. YR531]
MYEPRHTTMTMIFQLRDTLRIVREFVVPSYRPERHYMRGPGPACAQRSQPRVQA